VLDDDPGTPVHLADDLQPERPLGSGLEVTHHVVDRAIQRPSFEFFGDLVDVEASPRPISRTLPPHTMVGMDGSSIIGTSSSDLPKPHSSRTE
jgi:hypothetical protein